MNQTNIVSILIVHHIIDVRYRKDKILINY